MEKQKASSNTKNKSNNSTQKDRDKEEQENLRLGYEQSKETYRYQQERHKAADEKLNMLLVFNSAAFALLIVVLPIENYNCIKSTLLYTFLVLFVLSMLMTFIFILIGIFPRETKFSDNSNYINPKTYQCTNIEFYGKFIKMYQEANDGFHDVIEKKLFYGKFALISSIFNIVFILTLLVIKMI